MDQVRMIFDFHGTDIQATVLPTHRHFRPLLLKNKASIKIITPRTEAYGSHPRQKLDVYNSEDSPRDAPVLIFLYGGGFVRGDKILAAMPEGLVYHNVGTFFAQKGFTTIIPDYRRVNSSTGGEDALYPSGAEDLSLVLDWVDQMEPDTRKDLYIMGQSAGGMHLASYLLAPQFKQQRESFLLGTHSVNWQGAIFLSVPFHFPTSTLGSWDRLVEYYGTENEAQENCPFGLLKRVAEARLQGIFFLTPKVMIITAEHDPVDCVLLPGQDFVRLWNTTFDPAKTLHLLGHNHFTATLALMSGDSAGEEWTGDLLQWLCGPSLH
ncbi:alpha/beta-hydrolase [Penicillium herquei]|nr:alpha/beta-hydrolase [Penicillium herquei]